MSHGPVSAEESVLLDYVWPLIPTILWNSTRFRHYPVLVATAGVILLNVIVVDSTALLVLKPTLIPVQSQVEVQEGFDASPFWNYVLPTTTSLTEPRIYQMNESWNPSYTNISTDPFYSYLRLLKGQSAGDFGVSSNMAFPTFTSSLLMQNLTSVTASIDVFQSHVDCEPAAVTLIQGDYGLEVALDSATCRAGHKNVVGSSGQLLNQSSIRINDFYYCSSTDTPLCPIDKADLIYTMQRVECGKGPDSPYDSANPSGTLDANTAYTYRYALVAVSRSWEAKYNTETLGLNPENPSLLNTSAVMCKITYDIAPRKVERTFGNTSYIVNEANLVPARKLTDLSELQLSELVFASLFEGRNAFVKVMGINDEAAYSMLSLMQLATSNKSITDIVMDPTKLQHWASKVFSELTAHIMQGTFLAPKHIDVSGKGQYSELRLHFGTVPLAVMLVSLFVMFLFALVLNFVVKRDLVPRDLSNLASHAMILASSSGLQKALQSSGHVAMDQLTEKLKDYQFQTVKVESFGIECCPATETTNEHSQRQEDITEAKAHAWIPLIARKPGICSALAFPVLMIAVLEILYSTSIRRGGIINVTGDDSVKAYMIRYSSTLVALGIATAFGSLDLAISTFAPFSALRADDRLARRGMTTLAGSDPPIISIYTAVRDKHYGAACSDLASTIGSLLTIMVSGLWVFDGTGSSYADVTGLQVSSWQTSWNSTMDDGGATQFFDKIQHGLVAQPANIWEDLVLPDIDEVTLLSGDTPSSLATGSLRYSLRVPALRPSLSCEAVASRDIDVHTKNEDYPVSFKSVEASTTSTIPSSCNLDISRNFTSVTLNATYRNKDEMPAWGGNLIDLQVGSQGSLGLSDGLVSNNDDDFAFFDRPYTPDGCPSIGAVFANWNLEMTAEDVTMILCQQRLQQVMVNVSYISDGTSFSVDKTRQPEPDDSTAEYLTNGTAGVESFSYHIRDHLDRNLTQFSHPGLQDYDHAVELGNNVDVSDMFFNHLIYGPNGTTQDMLSGPENVQRFINRIDLLYRRYMVHIINANFDRGSQPLSKRRLSPSQAGSMISGVAIAATPRLRVAYGSKIALQILLGVMTIFGMAAYSLVDLRGTLPRNPCSIASTMALFADSKFCEPGRVPPGAEFFSDRELEKVWVGKSFSLGWWYRDCEKAGKVFGVDIGEANVRGFDDVTWKYRLRKHANTTVTKD